MEIKITQDAVEAPQISFDRAVMEGDTMLNFSIEALPDRKSQARVCLEFQGEVFVGVIPSVPNPPK